MWENREMKVEEVILDLVNERFLIHGVTGLRKKHKTNTLTIHREKWPPDRTDC